MQQNVLAGVVEWVAYTVLIVAMLGAFLYVREITRLLVRIFRWVFPAAPPPPAPLGRPIEAIARDAQRLGARFRDPPDRQSFARFEGLRRSYDDVLAEACHALGIPDLMTSVPPGPERDAERLRIEFLLGEAGLGHQSVG